MEGNPSLGVRVGNFANVVFLANNNNYIQLERLLRACHIATISNNCKYIEKKYYKLSVKFIL
jgi:hypothetical protein